MRSSGWVRILGQRPAIASSRGNMQAKDGKSMRLQIVGGRKQHWVGTFKAKATTTRGKTVMVERALALGRVDQVDMADAEERLNAAIKEADKAEPITVDAGARPTGLQHGSLRIFNKRNPTWKGRYYEYQTDKDGITRRNQRTILIGSVDAMSKDQARQVLNAFIARAEGAEIDLAEVLELGPPSEGSTTAGGAPEQAHGSMDLDPEAARLFAVVQLAMGKNADASGKTLRWFWEHRFRPLKEPSWKESNAPKMIWSIEHYVVRPFGTIPLEKLERFALQDYLNRLAKTRSKSVVAVFRTYMKAILDEAVEQGFLTKNPARILTVPKTRKQQRRVLTMDEIAALLSSMAGRDRLIVRMFLVLGLRPGELFALRRNDLSGGYLRIDESLSPLVGIVEPKTDASAASVWVPASLATEIEGWLNDLSDKRPEAFLFPSENRETPIAAGNWLKRVLKVAGAAAAKRWVELGNEAQPGFLDGLTLQSLRRSCATHLQHLGSVKDVQGHLRHSRPDITAAVYMQEIPASVRAAVENLDAQLTQQRMPDASESTTEGEDGGL